MMMIYSELKKWLEENQIDYIEKDSTESYKVPDPQNILQRRFTFLAPKKIENRELKKLTIVSNNGKMNLDLIFYKNEEQYDFEDIVFGRFYFEFGSIIDHDSFVDLIDIVQSIITNKMKILSVSYADTGEWILDHRFDMSDPEEQLQFNRYMARVDKKKCHPYIRKGSMMHEIYDWNTYDCIVRD